VNIIKHLIFLLQKISVKILLAIFKKYRVVYLITILEFLITIGIQYKIHTKICWLFQIKNLKFSKHCILIKAIKILYSLQIQMKLMKDMLLIIS